MRADARIALEALNKADWMRSSACETKEEDDGWRNG